MNPYEDTLRKLSMIQALSGNNIELFGKMLSNGWSVNEDLYGSLPIHEICRYGYLEFLKFLTTKGAHLNKEDGFGRTAIMISAEHGNLNCLKFLAEKHVELDKRIAESAMNCLNEETIDEVVAYVTRELIPEINWIRRKGLVFAYKHRKLKLPLSLIKEISCYLA